jgi:hypothetical protein
MGTQLAAAQAIGVRDINPEQFLYIYDLAALSEREDENLFPPDVLPNQGIRVVEEHWGVDSMIRFVLGAPPGPPLITPLLPEDVDSLRDSWLEAVKDDPGGYLVARGRLFVRQISVTRSAQAVYHPGIDQGILNPSGYEITFPGPNSAATDYLSAFTHDGREDGFLYVINGGLLYSVWIYLLIAAAACLVLLRSRSPTLLTVGALALSAVTLQVGLFIAAMGTQFRYEFPAVIAALLAGAVTVGYLLERRRKLPALD